MKKYALLPLLFAAALPAQAASKPAARKAVVPAQTAAPAAFTSPQAEAQYHVLVGEVAVQRDQPGVAAKEFLLALDLIPDPQLAARATGLALGAGDDTLALDLARRWEVLEPTSPQAREVAARLALRNGKVDEAYAECETMLQAAGNDNGEAFRHIALMLAQEPAHGSDALTLIRRLRDGHPDAPSADYAVGLVALRFNDLPAAEEAGRRALKRDPGSHEAVLMLAGILVRRGALDEADQVIADAASAKPKSATELRLAYAKLLLDAEKGDRARAQLENVLKKDSGNPDAHFALGLLALEREKPDEAEPHLKVSAANGNHRSESAYYLGRIAELHQKPDQALKWYAQVEGGNSAVDAGIRRAMLLGKLGKVDEGRAVLEEMRNRYPTLEERIFLAEGEMLVESNRPKDAVDLYQEALSEDPDDADLLYARSLAYERLSQVDSAEADLREVLRQNGQDPRALNALGYMLAVHTDRLAEAHQLVAKALELQPDDAAIMDSLGWVDYREGKIDQALEMLKKAYARFNDPEIAAHLGEVLWASGDKTQARSVWNTALASDPNHPVLKETVDRLSR